MPTMAIGISVMHKYEDILNHPRPVSTRHAPMSMTDRAAQFSAFAALTGYDAVLQESARLTEQETILDESGKEILDRQLRMIAENIDTLGRITFLCFQQDEWKPGGSYVPICGRVKRIDAYRRAVLLEDGREFRIEDIRSISGVE